MAINIPGVVATVIFYVLVAAIGIISGKKNNKTGTSEEMFLANRNLGVFVCAMSLAATIMGGGSLLGTAEIIGRNGLVWCILPATATLALIIVCVFFIPKVLGHGYTTILDPFQLKYGKKIGALLFIPECISCLFWQAIVFTALGSTLSVILKIPFDIAVIVSASFTIGYTFFGGLSSVAYTDIFQLALILFGLALVLPFAITHPAVNMDLVDNTWIGTVPSSMLARYFDMWLLMTLGPATSQSLYQRVLACRSPKLITMAVLTTAAIYLLCIAPAVVIGFIGRSTDWNMTNFQGEIPLTKEDWSNIFPMVLQFLCPTGVSIIGIGMISAAVMSSADSAILATGSLFTYNIYHILFRPNASDREKVWVLRITILCTGAIGTVIALAVQSIFGLLVLASDLLYIVQFPQLISVLWFPFSNSYGCVSGYFIGFIMRVLSGEELLGLPVIIEYPFYDTNLGQLFPYKTFCLVMSLSAIVSVSYVTNYLFTRDKIHKKYDILKCFQSKGPETEPTAEISLL